MKPLYDEQGVLVQWYDESGSLIAPSVAPFLSASHPPYLLTSSFSSQELRCRTRRLATLQ